MRRKLYEEDIERNIVEQTINEIFMCDKNRDGAISYKDLYDYMLGNIPQE